ncbi:putative nucleoside transporter [Aspergillus fischeri NRRL 181]|uniref:Uncharacterized protein n=1 Tax=Neosartorya fischeri (strain ATCC 1020 / DSM 3700 / CBS 544.65 / FGSC A1164 / JCM 1740 / NRRL 181 / WB 181) TaxID=331117 RepID=A1DFP1_NEOFI|nr:conserved hypothetical protein [Aspergillus fischeri NRRL 181]EAW18198.1 conserved hypothetical protein [Aspergillus fischeri NRRL 181]
MDPRSLNAEEKAHPEPASIPVEKQEPVKPRGLLSRIRYYEEVLDRKLGIESHSLDRVIPENRKPPNSLAMAFMWASATINISCFSTGFLGKEFGLSLGQTIAITICATFLGAAVTGCAVSDGRVSIAVGVVIVACVSFLFSFVGLRGVLMYEQYAWILFFIIFMIIYGESAHRANLAAPATVTGLTRSGNALTLIGVVYGSSASWSSIVSDFYVHYPVNTPKIKIFLYTTLGITIPTCIGMLLGACISSALDTNPEWAAAYENGIGYRCQSFLSLAAE